MPVKPFTLMGEGMLVTVGALMPGGVLPPAAIDKKRTEHAALQCFSPKKLWKSFYFDSYLVTTEELLQ